MAEYVFEVTAQQWRTDPYYVASSAPVHKVEVIASTETEAKVEAERVLGPPVQHRYWRLWIKRGRDVRLITGERESSDG